MILDVYDFKFYVGVFEHCVAGVVIERCAPRALGFWIPQRKSPVEASPYACFAPPSCAVGCQQVSECTIVLSNPRDHQGIFAYFEGEFVGGQWQRRVPPRRGRTR